MKGKRTGIDFSKHELKVTEQEGLTIHHLQMPNTITNNIKFINTNGILAVTGDFGNWIFCREFHPSPGGRVSDGYWIEKLSSQDPYEYSAEDTTEVIQALIDNDLEDMGYEGDTLDTMKEWYEDLTGYVEDELEYNYMAYRDCYIPDCIDYEDVPFCSRTKNWLLIIFDGFEEICDKLRIIEESKIII